jgi:hypothetical protein
LAGIVAFSGVDCRLARPGVVRSAGRAVLLTEERAMNDEFDIPTFIVREARILHQQVMNAFPQRIFIDVTRGNLIEHLRGGRGDFRFEIVREVVEGATEGQGYSIKACSLDTLLGKEGENPFADVMDLLCLSLPPGYFWLVVGTADDHGRVTGAQIVPVLANAN